MNVHFQRLQDMRSLMREYSLNAWLSTGSDPHHSEYLPEHWKTIEWLTGFTGSYAQIVITEDDAVLWTDSRYHIQATIELEGSGWRLEKLKESKDIAWPTYLATALPSCSCIGFDADCTTENEYHQMQRDLESRCLRLCPVRDLPGMLWKSRPALPQNPIYILDKAYSGRSITEKWESLVQNVKNSRTPLPTAWIFSRLDQIAWLLNIRSSDIAYTPVAIAYLYATENGMILFTSLEKLSPKVRSLLLDSGIECQDYKCFTAFLESLPSGIQISCNPAETPCSLYRSLEKAGVRIISAPSPITSMMCIKNEVEIEGFRRACRRDGVALTRFFRWLESNMDITEEMAAQKLSKLRSENTFSMGDSFQTIAAMGTNAALPHYSPSAGHSAPLEAKGLFLVDSGGQYLDATTDVTRTIAMGPLSEEEKRDYTLVLKGMIRLASARFPEGTHGANLDILAREALWANGLDYGHGTGHGVGHFNGVHENPPDIRQAWRDAVFQSGMICSDEPGLYRAGHYGIRHEILILCRSCGETEFGRWLEFEPLTLCYFDTAPILPQLLTEAEKQWFNQYQQNVYNQLAPRLESDEAAWLKEKCKTL